MIYCILCTGYGTRKSHTNKPWKYGTYCQMCKLTNYLTIQDSSPYKGQTHKDKIFYFCKYSVWQIPVPCVSECLLSRHLVFIFILKHNNIYVGEKKRSVVSSVMSILSDIMNTKHKCAILLRPYITDFVSRTSDIKSYKHKLRKALLYTTNFTILIVSSV